MEERSVETTGGSMVVEDMVVETAEEMAVEMAAVVREEAVMVVVDKEAEVKVVEVMAAVREVEVMVAAAKEVEVMVAARAAVARVVAAVTGAVDDGCAGYGCVGCGYAGYGYAAYGREGCGYEDYAGDEDDVDGKGSVAVAAPSGRLTLPPASRIRLTQAETNAQAHCVPHLQLALPYNRAPSSDCLTG